MKRILTVLTLAVAILMVPVLATTLYAVPISFYENFSDQTIDNTPVNINQNGPLNIWQGFNWSVQTVDGNSYAQQQGPLREDHTNLLYYGLNGTNEDPGLYLLSFDYISNDRAVELAVFAGLDFAVSGGIDLDPFAGWFNETNDGVTIIRTSLPITQVWTHVAIPFQITTAQASDFDAYVVAFAMGGYGDTGTRVLDNVGVAAVPEPAAMLLLGSGLIGLAGFARRKLKK